MHGDSVREGPRKRIGAVRRATEEKRIAVKKAIEEEQRSSEASALLSFLLDSAAWLPQCTEHVELIDADTVRRTVGVDVQPPA